MIKVGDLVKGKEIAGLWTVVQIEDTSWGFPIVCRRLHSGIFKSFNVNELELIKTYENAPESSPEAPHGVKNDQGKVDYTLLLGMLPRASESVCRVLEYGADKYGRENWSKVESERYIRACLRHLVEYLSGESVDKESGHTHLSHAVANLMFVLEKE